MTRNEIIELVKAKLDEVHPLQAGQTIVNPQIEQQIDGVAVSLVEFLPSVLAFPVSASDTPALLNYVPGMSIDVQCPADFVRLHRLRFAHWMRPVVGLSPDGTKLLYQQDYDYLKSTVRRPSAALYTKDNTDFITCYPGPRPADDPDCLTDYPNPGDALVEFVYVQRPAAAEDLHDDLIEMLAWKVAADIYLIHGQADASTMCSQRLSSLVDAKLKYRS